MTVDVRWERIEPSTSCASPDGHEPMDVMVGGSVIPDRVLCSRCGADYTVVVLPRESLP